MECTTAASILLPMAFKLLLVLLTIVIISGSVLFGYAYIASQKFSLKERFPLTDVGIERKEHQSMSYEWFLKTFFAFGMIYLILFFIEMIIIISPILFQKI